MNILQELFKSTRLELITARLIARKIEERGYFLTDEQLEAVTEQAINSDKDVLTIKLSNDGIDLQISIENEDITRVLDEYTENLPKEMSRVVQQASEIVLAELRASALEMLKEHEKLKSNFEPSRKRNRYEVC